MTSFYARKSLFKDFRSLKLAFCSEQVHDLRLGRDRAARSYRCSDNVFG